MHHGAALWGEEDGWLGRQGLHSISSLHLLAVESPLRCKSIAVPALEPKISSCACPEGRSHLAAREDGALGPGVRVDLAVVGLAAQVAREAQLQGRAQEGQQSNGSI